MSILIQMCSPSHFKAFVRGVDSFRTTCCTQTCCQATAAENAKHHQGGHEHAAIRLLTRRFAGRFFLLVMNKEVDTCKDGSRCEEAESSEEGTVSDPCSADY